MTPDALGTAAAAVTAAVLLGLGARPVLQRLPEPVHGDGKRPYATLGTPSFRAACAVLAGATTAVGWLTQPGPLRPMWAVLGTLGLLLAAIDAQTTWLPLRLTRVAWLAMTIAGLAALPLGAGAGALGRAAGGAALAGGLYGVVWLVSRGGFGFGDVRFAPLIGAATAAHSWTLLVAALLAGSLLGAGHGLVRLARRRPGSFAYAPAMLGGAYVACIAAFFVET